MSMTIQIQLGLTDLDLLLEALKEMGHKTEKKHGEYRNKPSLAFTWVNDYQVGIVRNNDGELTLIGDSDWKMISDKEFQQKVQQQYGVAAVKKKAKELHYDVVSINDIGEEIQIKLRAWG
jgi:predicted RNA-binding protein